MTTERARAAAERTFPGRAIIEMVDLNRGRGVFSDVVRVRFAPGSGEPETVAVKLAVAGPNGDAARRSGAYEREALAYRSVLPHIDVAVAACHAVLEDPLGPTFVLEDLSHHRQVDQLDGLDGTDARAIAATLGRLHASGRESSAIAEALEANTLRRNTVSSLDPTVLRAGLDVVADRWSRAVERDHVEAFRQVVERHPTMADCFSSAGPAVFCHGDPRADNLVFDEQHRPVLFDWQQIAWQPGVGDLAWLAATSLEPDVRRLVDAELVSAYRSTSGDDTDHEAYRIGFALPGLAVLYLAQREATDERTTAFIATSLRRIGQALVDLAVGDIVAG